MPSYLLVSDVYCPWCYSFGPVFERLRHAHPLPAHVLAGELVDSGRTIDDMVMETPAIKAFFKRLGDQTGRGIGRPYLDLLDPGKGSMAMDSAAMSVPLAALREMRPGLEVEQLDALQSALYQEGKDVLDPCVQAEATGVDEEALILKCSEERIRERADKDRAEALRVLGDFVIYPTLFLVRDDGERVLLARGYTNYETVLSRFEKGMRGASDAEASVKDTGHGHSCGPDGCTL